MKTKLKRNYTLEGVIEGRLALQSTQRELKKFGFYSFTQSTLDSPEFLKRYCAFNTEKRKQFLQLVGGNLSEKLEEILEGKVLSVVEK